MLFCRTIGSLSLCAALAACGARDGLRYPGDRARDGAVPDASSSADAAADVAPSDAVVDVSPIDRCRTLALAVEPTSVLASPRADFVTPRVVSRSDGFDILGPVSGDGITGIHARHMTLGAARPVQPTFSDIQIVGDGAWTWAEAGTDGQRLGLVYFGDGASLRVWSGAFTNPRRGRADVPPGVGTPRGLVWNGDHWVAAWADYNGPSFLSTFASDGMLLETQRSRVALNTTTPAIVGYSNGIAMTSLVAGSASVVFIVRDGREITQRVTSSAETSGHRIAAWSEAPGAVAHGWRDASGVFSVERVSENDGVRGMVAISSPDRGPVSDVTLAPFRGGVIAVESWCSSAGDTAGFDLHWIGNDFTVRAATRFDAHGCAVGRSAAAIATNDRDVALAWIANGTDAPSRAEIHAAVVSCAE